MRTIEKHLSINSKNLPSIVNVFRDTGAKLRLVGGAVRDALIGVPGSDIDLATDLLPEEVMALLKKNKIKAIPTGIKFGTITAVIDKELFEITTLRADLDCDGRHAKVKYSKDFAEDAARRDFTINALSYCLINHIIYDYFGGTEDLENKKVKFIGDPEERIREDYLRILRFFRFSCRFAKEIDPKGLAACIKAKDRLEDLSKERIKSELDTLLQLTGSPKILSCMFDSGILKKVLPPVASYDYQRHLKALKVAADFKVALDLPVIYALLFCNVEALALNKLLELKFSRADAKTVLNLLALETFSNSPEELVIHLKSIWLDDKSYLLYFVYASLIVSDEVLIYDLYKELSKREIPVLPIDGNQLLKLGYSGKELGNLLSTIKKSWIKSNFTLSQEQLINLVKK